MQLAGFAKALREELVKQHESLVKQATLAMHDPSEYARSTGSAFLDVSNTQVRVATVTVEYLPACMSKDDVELAVQQAVGALSKSLAGSLSKPYDG